MNLRSIFGVFKGTPLLRVKIHLGRWNTHHNYRESMLKMKYANEDNCGFSYHNCKNITQIEENKELHDNNDYIYMMGYESIHK